MNERSSQNRESANRTVTLSRPVVGDEHLNAFGSAVQFSILRDLCLEAGAEGRVDPVEATASALTYARLAASIGGAPEAVAAATLLVDNARGAATAGAFVAAQASLREAAVRYQVAAEAGSDSAAERLSGVLSDPLYCAPTLEQTKLFDGIESMFRAAALGDCDMLVSMVDGSLSIFDLRSLVAAEQFARLAASDGKRASAMALVTALCFRARWEHQPGGNIARGAWAVAEALSIAHAYAAEGDQDASRRAASLADGTPPAMFALVAQTFPPALIYRNAEGEA
ncbi:hypothetical protein [uncultured Sphingomonas sp.]|uniref:hypothetical protein n=1 Tax=uncultured Sphingomonas sp. TaxID=158754 RepID=UPI0025E4AE0C|nr:hypothetical protein [uncultured Sphingomonas sp.]